MIAIREALDDRGRSMFRRWLDRLDAVTAARVVTALYRLEQGNSSNVKGVGAGVFELRIDFGPGYRVYFGSAKRDLVILLGGGSKRRQSEEIASAQAAWKKFRRRERTRSS